MAITLLAIDPSVRSIGVALFNGNTLARCANLRVVSDKQRGELCASAALNVRAWYDGIRTEAPDRIVFEWPQVYRAVKSKGDPNDLLGLVGVGMSLATYYYRARLSTPTPAEWIGQCPKTCSKCRATKSGCPRCNGSPWSTPRGMRIASKLFASESALVPDQHDAIDAVGLGLWALGRLKIEGVFPGAI